MGVVGRSLSSFPASNLVMTSRGSDKVRLQVLADVSRAVSGLDGEEVLQSLVQLVVPRLADWCSIAVKDGAGLRSIALAHRDRGTGQAIRERLRSAVTTPHAPPRGALAVAHTGIPVLHPAIDSREMEQLSWSPLDAEVARELGLGAAAIVPVPAGEAPTGALTLATLEAGGLDEDDLQFAMELGRRAGAALEKARLLHSEQLARIAAEHASELAKQAENLAGRLAAEAERSRAQLEATFQAMNDGVLAVDRAGNVVLMNEAEAQLSGYETAAAMRLDFQRFDRVFELRDLDDQIVSADRWPIARILRGETLNDLELSGLRRDTGQLWYLSFSGRPIHDDRGRQTLALLLTRDVTARKVAEDAIRHSERRFRFLAENVPQIVWTANPEGAIDYYNDRWFSFSGRQRVRGIEESWISLLHPEDLTSSLAAWERSVATGQPFQIEHRLRDRSTGGSRWFLARALPLRGPDDAVQQWFGTFTDIQDQKEAEQELEQALHIREDFLAIAGHELKTPLTALLMHIQGLQAARKNGAAPANQDERLEKASRSGTRLATLIDQMLDVSRIAAGRLQLEAEEFDLDGLIREVLDRFSDAAAKAGSTIQLRSPKRVPGTWDRLRLEQVVTNLLGNALKYGQGQGIEVDLDADAATAVLRFTDHGIGILPDLQQKIFERFERAVGAREFGGFGLGLWITRQIVEASGGHIAVESTPGAGSVFTVRLPRQPSEVAHAPQT